MKKVLVLLIGFLTLNLSSQINVAPIVDSLGKHVTGVSKVVYNDSKSVIKYGVEKIEQASDSVYRILNRSYVQLAKGSAHVYDVMKTQQLVKSFHHLFYWLLGVFITITIIVRFKKHSLTNKANDWQLAGLVSLLAFDVVLSIYNVGNFMEMWTGFLNPEYGVYMEILSYLPK